MPRSQREAALALGAVTAEQFDACVAAGKGFEHAWQQLQRAQAAQRGEALEEARLRRGAARDAQDLMAYPFFSLAKSPRIVPIRFEAGGISLTVEAALAAVQSGRINNAMSIIALQWLELNLPRVRTELKNG